MNDSQQTLTDLKTKRDSLSRKKAAADERVRSAKKQRDKSLEKLKQLGISDPKTIPERLAKFKGDAENLVAEIEGGVPEAYIDGN